MWLIQGKTFYERHGGTVWNQNTHNSNLGHALYLMCGHGQVTTSVGLHWLACTMRKHGCQNRDGVCEVPGPGA